MQRVTVHAAKTHLSRLIEAALAGGDVVVAQKVRLGKWPEMVAFVDQLPGLLQSQGGAVAAFGPSICLEGGTMDWAHRDPFGRLLAATARQASQILVSADAAFDGAVTRVW